MAPTTLNGFHHIETDKTGMKTISQIFGGFKSGDSNVQYNKISRDNSCNYFSGNNRFSSSNPAERLGVGIFKSCFSTSRTARNRPKDHDTSYLFGTPPSKTNDIITTERPRVLGIQNSLNRQQDNLAKQKPTVITRSRPKDHDISYLFGTAASQRDRIKIIENPPVPGIEGSSNLPQNYLINDETKIITRRPKDHDKSYLFGTLVPKNDEIKSQKNSSAAKIQESANLIQNYLIKEKPIVKTQRPKDHDTSYLLGACKPKSVESIVQTHQLTPSEQQLQYLPKKYLATEKPKVIVLRPKDHDSSYLFGNYASKYNQNRNLRQFSAPARIQNLGKDYSSKVKPRGLLYHPKDHDTSYLFGASVSKNDCNGIAKQLKSPKAEISVSIPKDNLVELKSRVVLNKPIDHGRSYLFGTAEPITQKTTETKLTYRAPNLPHNCQNNRIDGKPKVSHFRPKDHDISYLFGASAFRNYNSRDTEGNLSPDAQGIQNPSTKIFISAIPRVMFNRPKDHEKSYLFGTPVLKTDRIEIIENASGIQEPLDTSLNASNKGKPRVILNRPKDHDCSYFFGTPTVKNEETYKPKEATGFGMRRLQNIFPSAMEKDKLKVVENTSRRNKKPPIPRELKKTKTADTKCNQPKAPDIENKLSDNKHHFNEHKIINSDATSSTKGTKEKEKINQIRPALTKEPKNGNQEQENIKSYSNIRLENSVRDVKKISRHATKKSSVHRLTQSPICKPMCKQTSTNPGKKPFKKRENGEHTQKMQKQSKKIEDGQEKNLDEIK